MIFITEAIFWLRIALANSVHLQKQITSTHDCPTSPQTTLKLTTASSGASSYLQWMYPPRYRVHSHRYFLQQGLQHFLLCSRVPYGYHASVSGPTRDSRFTLYSKRSFSPHLRNSSNNSAHSRSPKRPAQLSHGFIAQPLTTPVSVGNVALSTPMSI